MGDTFKSDAELFVEFVEPFWDGRTRRHVKNQLFSNVNPATFSQFLGRKKHKYQLWVDYENPIGPNTYRAYQTNKTTGRVRTFTVEDYSLLR